MTHLMNAAGSTSMRSTCRGFAGVAMAAHDRASRPHTRLCRRPAPSLCRREASRTSYRLSSAYSGPAALARRSWTEHCDEFANKPREISYPAELLPGHATSAPCRSHQNAITGPQMIDSPAAECVVLCNRVPRYTQWLDASGRACFGQNALNPTDETHGRCGPMLAGNQSLAGSGPEVLPIAPAVRQA
jgi:hypothetical protein